MDPEGIQREREGERGDGVKSVSAERSSQAAVMFPAALINMQMCSGKTTVTTQSSEQTLMQLFTAVMSASAAAVYTAVKEGR